MRSCLIATGLARPQGLAEDQVADTFYTALLTHVGCSALSQETAAVFGDELAFMSAVARTNVADPADIAGTQPSCPGWRGAGHAPHLTNPDDYVAAVTDFVARPREPAAAATAA